MLKKILFIIVLVSLLIGCSSKKTLSQLPSEVKWQRAEAYFNARKYPRAIPYYQQLIFEKNSIYTGDAQVKLGDCYFNTRKFVEAIFEYQELLRLFPDHRLASDAQFKIGLSYTRLSLSPHFTQEETHRAIENFTRFIEKYPNDSRVAEAYKHIADMQIKLIEKVYLNGYIYFKMRDYSASLLYLNEIIALGNRNELEKKSLYYVTLIHIDRKDKEAAMATYQQLKNFFPETKELRRIQKRISRI